MYFTFQEQHYLSNRWGWQFADPFRLINHNFLKCQYLINPLKQVYNASYLDKLKNVYYSRFKISNDSVRF